MIIGIIPARYQSTRLQGKPLALIGDKHLIEHTYNSAKKSKFLDKLIVAVDDQRVADVVEGFGGDFFMTSTDFTSGSDRIAFVAEHFADADIIVNIQGDEPFIPSEMIDRAIEPLIFNQAVTISTIAKRITTVNELTSSSTVKVVFDNEGDALYFSRAAIPFVRENLPYIEKINSYNFYKHIGLYVFRRDYLKIFTSLQPSFLEQIEKLEQLRLLENGYKIKVVITELDSISVDTSEDLKTAREYYSKFYK